MRKEQLSTAFCNGFEDRHTHGLLRGEKLYRSWHWNFAWRAGWELANVLTTRPLRNEKEVRA